MTRIETKRYGMEAESETKLLMLIGDTYLEWFTLLGLKEPKLLFYFFAYIFEQQYRTRGTDLHKHITKILFGKEVDLNGERATAIAAVLDYPLESYERARKTGHREDEEYPPFVKVER